MDNKTKALLINKFKISASRLVLLDYDGTLVKYELIPNNARPTKPLFEILSKFDDNPETDVFIITGRGYEDIDYLLDHLPVKIIAEHGAMIRENGVWKNQLSDTALWKKGVKPIFNHFRSACPGSFVEEKSFSMTWHYRNADSECGYANSRILISLLEREIPLLNLKILDGNKIVEVMSAAIGKGKAVRKLVEQKKYDMILCIGDDATDEEMFEFLKSVANSYTFKVGSGMSHAAYNLRSTMDVIQLLKQLSK